jgi:hypothetical protein
METEGLLEIKQHFSVTLERRIDELMERIEQEGEDEDLEAILIPLIAGVRAASEVARQMLAVEAEVATHVDLREQLMDAGSDDAAALSGERARVAQERLDVLTQQLNSMKEQFDV